MQNRSIIKEIDSLKKRVEELEQTLIRQTHTDTITTSSYHGNCTVVREEEAAASRFFEYDRSLPIVHGGVTLLSDTPKEQQVNETPHQPVQEQSASIASSCYVYTSNGNTAIRRERNVSAENCEKEASPEEDLCKCFKILLPEEAHNWKNIGVLLEILYGVLDCIEADYRGKSRDCLREMLREWIKRTPDRLWTQLAEAVEVINPIVAEKIRALQQ